MKTYINYIDLSQNSSLLVKSFQLQSSDPNTQLQGPMHLATDLPRSPHTATEAFPFT